MTITWNSVLQKLIAVRLLDVGDQRLRDQDLFDKLKALDRNKLEEALWEAGATASQIYDLWTTFLYSTATWAPPFRDIFAESPREALPEPLKSARPVPPLPGVRPAEGRDEIAAARLRRLKQGATVGAPPSLEPPNLGEILRADRILLKVIYRLLFPSMRREPIDIDLKDLMTYSRDLPLTTNVCHLIFIRGLLTSSISSAQARMAAADITFVLETQRKLLVTNELNHLRDFREKLRQIALAGIPTTWGHIEGPFSRFMALMESEKQLLPEDQKLNNPRAIAAQWGEVEDRISALCEYFIPAMSINQEMKAFILYHETSFALMLLRWWQEGRFAGLPAMPINGSVGRSPGKSGEPAGPSGRLLTFDFSARRQAPSSGASYDPDGGGESAHGRLLELAGPAGAKALVQGHVEVFGTDGALALDSALSEEAQEPYRNNTPNIHPLSGCKVPNFLSGLPAGKHWQLPNRPDLFSRLK